MGVPDLEQEVQGCRNQTPVVTRGHCNGPPVLHGNLDLTQGITQAEHVVGGDLIFFESRQHSLF